MTMLGKHHSVETKARISNANMGNTNGGHPCKQETKDKISAANLKEGIEVICLTCGIGFSVCPSEVGRKFCSKECYYTSRKGRPNPTHSKKMKIYYEDPENRQAAVGRAKSRKKVEISSEQRAQWVKDFWASELGEEMREFRRTHKSPPRKPVSDEGRKNQSISKKAFLQTDRGKEVLKIQGELLRGKPQSNDHKLKNREGVLRAIEEGRISPHKNSQGIKTAFESAKSSHMVYCDSNWELWHARSLEKNPNVLSFEKDKVRIPYYFEGTKYIYIPDFLVREINQTFLEEVRPYNSFYELPTSPVALAKFQAAKTYCIENGWEFRLLTREEEL